MLYDDEYIARAIVGQYADYESQWKMSLKPLQKVLFYIIKLGMIVCYGIIIILCHIPILSSLVETIARTYSRGAVGFFLRGAYYKNKLKRMGKNVFIDVGVIIWEPQNVEIDDYVFIDTYVTMLGGGKGHGFIQIGKYTDIASNCVLAGRGGITLGEHIGIGAGSKIYSGSHLYRNPEHEDNKLLSGSALASFDKQYVIEKPVVIGDYAWMGVNTVVVPGVKIGKGGIIGAGSIVNTDIPAFTVAVGAPAKVIKRRPHIE